MLNLATFTALKLTTLTFFFFLLFDYVKTKCTSKSAESDPGLIFFSLFIYQILRIKGFNVGWFKWSFFRNFENTFSCFAVAIFDLVHDMEAIFTFLNCYKYLETVFLIEPRYEKTGFLHVRKKDADQLRGNREAD